MAGSFRLHPERVVIMIIGSNDVIIELIYIKHDLQVFIQWLSGDV